VFLTSIDPFDSREESDPAESCPAEIRLVEGRFTEGRIAVLERLRDELRKRGYLPIVFNFDKPETKDSTENVRLLAGLSKLIIADVTKPRSAPLELQATVPECMVRFRAIIQEGESS